MTINDLNVLFPKLAGRKNHALTGLIPMGYFNAHEAEIRAACREHFNDDQGYRIIYRGPRYKPGQTMTHRADATHALVYWR